MATKRMATKRMASKGKRPAEGKLPTEAGPLALMVQLLADLGPRVRRELLGHSTPELRALARAFDMRGSRSSG